MRILLVCLALLAAAPTVAAAADPSIEDGSAQRALDGARERWAAAGLVDYDFRLSLSCFCPDEVRQPRTLKVRDGRATNANRYNRRYATVPKLFAAVQEAIASEVDSLKVRYAKSGLPRSIFVDRSEMIADEELGLSASRLRPR